MSFDYRPINRCENKFEIDGLNASDISCKQLFCDEYFGLVAQPVGNGSFINRCFLSPCFVKSWTDTSRGAFFPPSLTKVGRDTNGSTDVGGPR